MRDLTETINCSFKVLWDGSVSLFKDSILAASNNKDLVSTLLTLREQSANDPEPPITLLHGTETEQVVKSSLLRVKVEEAERLEEQKRIAREEGGEDMDEQEDNQTNNLDESREDAGSLQQDMSSISDFFCFDCPQFTMRIMQGQPIKSLYNLDVHRKKTKAEEEEDLYLLDEI